MKKITGFFLALMPIFVVILLFATGMLIKDYTHIFVTSVELNETSKSQQIEDFDQDKETFQLVANVLPLNATNPEVYYLSTDDNVVSVDQTGLVTYEGYGEASVYAVSKENQTIKSKCDFDVWDTQMHAIDIKNEFLASYVGFNQTFNLNATPVPATHLEGDASFSYSSSKESVATVDIEGNVQAKEELGTTTITIHNDTWDITKTIDVTVGVGVNAIDFENPNNITVEEQNYNLYNDIITYPEQKENVPATDFAYTSNDPDVAKVDENGVITFFKQKPATFNVEYRRKPLTLTKTIESTCNSFSDVLFNRYTYTANIADFEIDKYIDPKVLNWHIYPENCPDQDQKIDITSSNPNVVEVTSDKRLYVHNHGTTMLYITVHENGKTKMDMCSITINSDDMSFIKEPTIQLNNTFCYYLRDNIDSTKLANANQKIEWELNSDIAWVDKYDILHFKQATETSAGLQVTAKVVGTGQTQSFHVKCAQIQTRRVNVSSRQMVLQVGQRYHFEDEAGYEWYPTNTSNFDVVEDGFITSRYYYIPKAGCNVSDFEFYSGGIIPEYLHTHLIVAEKPMGIWFDPDKIVYATAKPEIKLSDVCSILPATATDTLGNPYKLDLSYKAEDPSSVSISDDGIIVFDKPGYVKIDASYGDFQPQTFFVKSTCGAAGKFSLVDNNGLDVQSGDSITLSPGQSVQYVLKDVFAADAPITTDLLNQFVVKSKNGSDTIEATKEIVEDGSGNSTIRFTITAKEKSRGDDVIVIESGKFNFYLNLSVTDKVHDYQLFYNGTQLDSLAPIVTYINRLKLDIITNPIKLIGQIPTATLNGTAITVGQDLKLDLTDKLNVGDNILILSSSDAFSKTFNITLKSPDSIEGFTIKEAKDDNIYIQCGGLQKTLTLDVNGIIDSQFFNDNFTIDFSPKATESVEQFDDKVYIKSLPMPTPDEPGYENNFTINFNSQTHGTISNEYKISRDIVSRIVFPDHDNNNPDICKGLQKVKVTGMESFYSPEEGHLLYTKLRFNLYDFRNNLITDQDEKKKAFDTLDCTISDGCSATYHAADAYNADSFMEIKFDQRYFYYAQQISKNLFADPLRQHNVLFSLAAHSTFAEAHFTFVPVRAREVYHQDGFSQDGLSIVLGTNFGLPEGTKDNVEFENTTVHYFHEMYGNGYTINFNAYATAHLSEEKPIISFDSICNATIQGCNDDILNQSGICAQTNEWPDKPTIFSYSTFLNLPNGLQIWNTVETHIENCLFYNNTLTSINASGGDKRIPDVYVENTILFNCSSVAIDVTPDVKLYLKGFIDVYNFKNRDLLKNIFGFDLRFMWDILIPEARAKHMLQMGPDGREYVNSYMATLLAGGIYFWDAESQSYKLGTKGNPDAANHLQPFFDLSVPILGSVTLWGTPDPNFEHGSPSYYDQFDGNGKLRWDFLNIQIDKISRVQTHWWF